MARTLARANIGVRTAAVGPVPRDSALFGTESAKISFQFPSRHWSGEKIALCFMAAECAQYLQLLVGLNSFSYDRKAKTVAEVDGGCGNRLIVTVAYQIPNEGLVDLKAVQWKAFEVGQA